MYREDAMDTICAISTPLGESGIGLIRLSGPQAVRIAQRVFRRRPEARLEALPSHTIHYGLLFDPCTGETLDEVLLSLLRAPRTYTREDMVEIGCHGGPLLLRRVLGLLVQNGSRASEPGEFTRRAFLNGRIDLTQAEAVMEVIRARTETGIQVALEQLQGGLGRKIQLLQDRLLGLLAQVEARIDFSEEGLQVIQPEGLREPLEEVFTGMLELLAGWAEGRILREGLAVAIAGRPNVGKSSLLNALLRTDRAIVTPAPGTTRDLLEEALNIQGMTVRVLDMAGLRETQDPVEREGIRRAWEAIDRADLVLWVLDASQPLQQEDVDLMDRLRAKRKIGVLNKSDLGGVIHKNQISEALGGAPVVQVAATVEKGLEELKEKVWEQALNGRGGFGEGSFPISSRHKAALEKAGQATERAVAALDRGEPEEFLALEIRAAVDYLGEIIGTTTTEDLLDQIFGQFCIGK